MPESPRGNALLDAQYHPNVRYDVIDENGLKVGEVVHGVLFEGAPDYQQKVGMIAFDTEGAKLTLHRRGRVFELVPQPAR